MEYNGFLIEEDNTGIAPKNSRFHFYISGDEVVTGWGESIEGCEKKIDEINLCEVLKDADLLESSFIRWIVKNGWMYIVPLKIYQHKNKEIYKTKSELNDIFLSQRHS